MKVAVVDYGIGNVFSVMAALRAIDIDFVHDKDGSSIATADVALVPGVATFGSGLERIRESGQAAGLDAHFTAGKPLLGLCLGAQMFLEGSKEDPSAQGLGYVKGNVVELSGERCRVPNQNWLKTQALAGNSHGLRQMPLETAYFYYSHSYRMEVQDSRSCLAETRVGLEVILSIYQEQNVVGIQFHPERSGSSGLELLRHVLEQIH